MRISDWSSDGCSSDLLVARNIAEIIIETAPQRAVDILKITVESAAADIGPGRRVIRLDALGVRLRDHRDGVPADHRSGLDALQRTDRRDGGAFGGLPAQVARAQSGATGLGPRQKRGERGRTSRG